MKEIKDHVQIPRNVNKGYDVNSCVGQKTVDNILLVITRPVQLNCTTNTPFGWPALTTTHTHSHAYILADRRKL